MKSLAVETHRTIFALCTGSPPTAVAVFRISGPLAIPIAERCFVSKAKTLSRGMYFGSFVDAEGNHIDTGLLLVFTRPASFTGEDVVELQVHGSPGVVTTLHETLKFLGAVQADAGEFATRALANGKQSLEGILELADVFRTQDPELLNAIYLRREKTLDREIGELREDAIGLLAVLETAIDFSEEHMSAQDLAGPKVERLIQSADRLLERFQLLEQGQRPGLLVLVGEPNAGKSSLFNCLLGRERAIVSPVAGTTRDAVETSILLGGRRWTLVDTAGMRTAGDEIERQGQKMGVDFIQSSDFWILVVDGATGLGDEMKDLTDLHRAKLLCAVWNKSDQVDFKRAPERILDRPVLEVSCKTGAGLHDLVRSLENGLRNGRSFNARVPVPTANQASSIGRARNRLIELREHLHLGAGPEVLSELARMAASEFGQSLEPVSVDEVLGRVFSEFCIGK